MLGMMADSMAGQTEGMHAWSDGTFSNCRAARDAARRGAKRALLPDRPLLGRRPRPPLGDEQPRKATPSRSRDSWRMATTWPRGAWRRPPRPQRDAALLDYFKSRKTLGEIIHRFFGDPGLQVATARYAGPEHQSAVALLRQRLTDPGFASALSPAGAGGARASRRGSARLPLLHRPPRAVIGSTGRSVSAADFRGVPGNDADLGGVAGGRGESPPRPSVDVSKVRFGESRPSRSKHARRTRHFRFYHPKTNASRQDFRGSRLSAMKSYGQGKNLRWDSRNLGLARQRLNRPHSP